MSVLVVPTVLGLLTCAQLLILATISICCVSTLFNRFCALLIETTALASDVPGSSPTVCCKLFNIMFVLDLSRPESLHFTANTISMLINRSYPTCIGFVPIVETEDGVKMARVFCYLTQNYDRLPST